MSTRQEENVACLITKVPACTNGRTCHALPNFCCLLFLSLSLGLKYAVRKYPCGLITGTCPLAWTLSEATSRQAKVHNCVQPSARSHDEPADHLPLVRSKKALQNATVTFDTREHFTEHDIDELNEQYDAHAQAKDNSSSSRLSRARTHASKQGSRISTLSNRSNLTSISEKPWKP